jgi:TPP-dependent pyruvate/acetoin dehydrogenase alpha subunit
LNETAPRENPLVPNQKLLQIYTAIVEMRLLGEYAATLHHKKKLHKKPGLVRGQEACRVSTAIELQAGDLVSDAQGDAAMGLLFGAKVSSLLRSISTDRKKKERAAAAAEEEAIAKRLLPWIEGVEDRLKLALGAALACKTLKQSNTVIAYIDRTEVTKGLWKSVLSLSGKLELPIIFVILPEKGKKAGAVDLCARARAAGVPGIPVDANDAVALYRVAQESIGRTRGGGGPVLIDCVAAATNEQRGNENNEGDDPIIHMKKFLVERKVCAETWADHAGDALRKKIALVKSRLQSLS